MLPKVTVHPVAALEADLRREMFALMCRYYEAIDESAFQRDLDEKDFVILLTCDERLVGFSAAFCKREEVDGRSIRYLYSGDTVVEPEYWGPGYLIRAFFHAAGRLKAAEPAAPLYWLLLVMSHRTYRIMSSFIREFVPRIGRANDPELLAIRDELAARRYGEWFDPATGLIDFGASRGNLTPDLQNEEEKAGNAVVREFMTLNPECGRGVELTCLAELRRDNLRSYARARFEDGLAEGHNRSGAIRLAS
jgi:hypothetical protein